MAGENVAALYLELGVDVSRMEMDFETAQREMSKRMAALNAEMKKNRLRADIGISNLSGADREIEKLRLQEASLTREIDLQTKKVQTLKAALASVKVQKGAESGLFSRMETQTLAQEKALASLQSKLREIANTKVKLQIEASNEAFFGAEKRIQDSVAAINARIQNIRLKAEVDIASVRGANAELEKQKIELRAANKELDAQNAKLRQLGNAYKVSLRNRGADAAGTGAALTAYLRQQREVQQLTAKVDALRAASQKAGQQGAAAMTKIGAAATNAKAGVDKLKAGYTSLNTKIAALTAVAATGYGLFDVTKSAMEGGESVYKLANRLHLTAGEAANLNRMFQMSGVEVTAIIPLFARLDKQVMAAGEDGNRMTAAMSRFGFSLTDAAGNLLPLNKQLEQLAKGYKRAAKAGELEAYTADVLGARGAALIPILEDYAINMEAASRVKTTGLLNPKEAHELYIQWKVMGMEAWQLKTAMGAALMPVANELMPGIIDGFQRLVEVIRENKDGLKELGSAAGTALGGIASAIVGVIGTLGDLKHGIDDALGIEHKAKVLETGGVKLNRASGLGMVLGGALGSAYGGVPGMAAGSFLGAEFARVATTLAMTAHTKVFNQWDGLEKQYREKTGENDSQNSNSADAMRKWKGEELSETEKEKLEVLRQEQAERRKVMETAENQARVEKALSSSTSTKLKEQIKAIQERTQKSIASGKDASAAWKKAAEDVDEAVRKTAAEAEKVNDELDISIYKLSSSDLTGNLYDVDRAADALRERGADEEMVTREAELKKQRIIEQFNRETANHLDNIYETALQTRLNQIEREKQAWIQKGLDEVKATEAAEREKIDIMRDAALQVIKAERAQFKAYQRGGEEALKRTYMQQNGLTNEDLNITPEELEEFERAKKSMLENLLPYFSPDRETIKALERDRDARNVIRAGDGEWRTINPNAGEPIPPASSEPRPIEVNVNIENAVTQDNEGMQMLADAVADKITPAIEDALESDDNAY